ncbi:hypothetical protein NDU88_004205 [Pleurodeles waltl]|uniref:Uncharacterized protein n=1 Tax=Pleurodeles waltl TaxID=8319 RepID=A0AAV7TR73_PLEWA|nr:hypothetical protein NDU88_004205 [Pleurodeles waltl]
MAIFGVTIVKPHIDLRKNDIDLRRRRERRRRSRERRQHVRRRGVLRRREKDIVRRRQLFRRRGGEDTRRQEDLGRRRHGEHSPRQGDPSRARRRHGEGDRRRERVFAVGGVHRHCTDVEVRRREVLSGETSRRLEALGVTAVRRRGVLRRREDHLRGLEGFIQPQNPRPRLSYFQHHHSSHKGSRLYHRRR